MRRSGTPGIFGSTGADRSSAWICDFSSTQRADVYCVKVTGQGHWVRQWQPAFRDRHHRRHPGQWIRVWRPAHQECHHSPRR
ncbi:hypothetical protein [Streptomyces sp. NPDC091209]|uniref:hypothetical protein n=1 Tax=Streptomyces sp. NPDC091209 TaxID=3365974 RepID=UPI0037F426CF